MTDQQGSEVGVAFADVLAERARDPSKRKGERTRSKLKATTARLLQERGYRDLRVSDINEAAGVSNALFYIYFKNKEEITGEVLQEFLDQLSVAPRATMPADCVEEVIYRFSLSYTQRFVANAGLMYCLLQYGDEVPAFGQLWLEFNAHWSARMIRTLQRYEPMQFASNAEATLATTALGSMLDGLLRLLYLDKEPELLRAVATLGGEQAGLALLMTRLWFRALFAREMNWEPGPGYRLLN